MQVTLGLAANDSLYSDETFATLTGCQFMSAYDDFNFPVTVTNFIYPFGSHLNSTGVI
jgi:hypothetical protein